MRIIIPVDGTQQCINALNFITQFKAPRSVASKIYLLNVQKPLPMAAIHLMPQDAADGFYRIEAEKVFETVRPIVKAAGITVEEAFVTGKPADQIAAFAKEKEADLIIMGSHGRSALNGLLFGSVTNALLSQTKVPVLTIRDIEEGQRPSHKIGIAVDAGEMGEKVVDYVLTHAKLFGRNAKFYLINVSVDQNAFGMILHPNKLDNMTYDELVKTYQFEFEKVVNPLLPKFKAAGLSVTPVRLAGDTAVEIGDYCAREKLDVLVMGTHGYGRFQAAAMGSTAMRIASIAEVPLLIVR